MLKYYDKKVSFSHTNVFLNCILSNKNITYTKCIYYNIMYAYNNMMR